MSFQRTIVVLVHLRFAHANIFRKFQFEKTMKAASVLKLYKTHLTAATRAYYYLSCRYFIKNTYQSGPYRGM